jgi:hypothetical protein
MASASSGTKRRWVASAAGAALVTALILLLFRAPRAAPVPAGRGAATGAITLSARHADELAMRDLAPLFLPTRFNAVPSEQPRREPGRTFFDTDAVKLKFRETNPGVALPSPFPTPATPAEALADDPGPLLVGMGQTGASIGPAAPHAAHIEVFAQESGEAVLAQPLENTAAAVPPATAANGWQPLELMAAVDASGLVGPLVVTTGSGNEEIDRFFQNFLALTYRIGDRLPPGFYRIVVGP